MILLVEDNAGDIELLRAALVASGIALEMEVARTGERALARLADPTGPAYAVVVVDLNLAGIDGWAVIDALSHDPRHMRVPVVVLTSSTRQDDRARADALGVHCYWPKPDGFDGYVEIVTAIAALTRDVP